MADRVVAVVQGRMGSARLPGKSLMPLAGRSLISHVLERAAAIDGVHQVVLATSLAERDVALAQEADRLGFDVYCGSERDVLQRVTLAAAHAHADIVVRITGDCPLLAPDVGAEVLALYQRPPLLPVVYASSDTTTSGWPDGFDVEVFSMDILIDADIHATEWGDREHVTPWIRRGFTCATLKAETDRSHLKLSVDRQEDYERVSRVFGCLDGGGLTSADTFRALAKAGMR